MFAIKELINIIGYFLEYQPDILSPHMYCSILKKLNGREDEIKIEMYELIMERALTKEQIKSIDPLKEIIYLCEEIPYITDYINNGDLIEDSTDEGIKSLNLCIYLYIHQVLSNNNYNLEDNRENIIQTIDNSLIYTDYMIENTQTNINNVLIKMKERCNYIMEYIEDLKELESSLKWV
jgi:hypothetical protein